MERSPDPHDDFNYIKSQCHHHRLATSIATVATAVVGKSFECFNLAQRPIPPINFVNMILLSKKLSSISKKLLILIDFYSTQSMPTADSKAQLTNSVCKNQNPGTVKGQHRPVAKLLGSVKSFIVYMSQWKLQSSAISRSC